MLRHEDRWHNRGAHVRGRRGGFGHNLIRFPGRLLAAIGALGAKLGLLPLRVGSAWRESPVVVFTVYALIVSYFAARWRRRVRGVLAVIVGEALLVLFAWVHLQIPVLAAEGMPFFQDIDILPFQLMLYPYTVLVAVMGGFIVAMPRRAPVDSCWYCRYDLSSLMDEPGVLICPECGREHVGLGGRVGRPSGVERADLTGDDVGGRASGV